MGDRMDWLRSALLSPSGRDADQSAARAHAGEPESSRRQGHRHHGTLEAAA